MARKFSVGEFTQPIYSLAWADMLKQFNGFPALPYDEEDSSIVFFHVQDLPGINKQIIYNRVKEWTSINFGHINTVLHYENINDGKIIIKGVITVPYLDNFKNFWGKEKEEVKNIESSQSYILNIKNNKIKIEATNIIYNIIVMFLQKKLKYQYIQYTQSHLSLRDCHLFA